MGRRCAWCEERAYQHAHTPAQPVMSGSVSKLRWYQLHNGTSHTFPR
eukprot:COSAG01_NODE_40206_length_466_cov_1.422343_1_plen_46_part_10